MIREKYTIRNKEFTINITDGKIDSVRKKDILKNSLRVYDGEFIGVHGVYGEVKDEDWDQTVNNLELKIPYNALPTSNLNCKEDAPIEFNEKKFLKDANEFLEFLKNRYPNFVLSNKISFVDNTYAIVNDDWLELSARVPFYFFGILIKERGSLNIIDTWFSYAKRQYSVEELKTSFSKMFDVYDKKIAAPKGKVIVLMQSEYLMSIFEKHLNAEKFGPGTSLFSNKLGQKLFSDKLSLVVDKKHSMGNPFFDMEGTTLQNDEIFLIENGCLKRPFADKISAKKYGYELTASAGGEFDSVPSSAGFDLRFKTTANSLEELIADKEAIRVQVTMGQSYSDSGDFAAPIMDSYLVAKDEFKNRLSEFSLTANVYDIFGNNFLGIIPDPDNENNNFVVFETEI